MSRNQQKKNEKLRNNRQLSVGGTQRGKEIVKHKTKGQGTEGKKETTQRMVVLALVIQLGH